jgi:hypothetical protein
MRSVEETSHRPAPARAGRMDGKAGVSKVTPAVRDYWLSQWPRSTRGLIRSRSLRRTTGVSMSTTTRSYVTSTGSFQATGMSHQLKVLSDDCLIARMDIVEA